MDSTDKAIAATFILVILLLIGGTFAAAWIGAGNQSRVWEREGIHITQWEAFMGAKPAERLINLRESPK